MRVAYLTAGAGGMYCGSCLRDNALAAALLRRGRDVLLIPVYTPIRTDEADVSEGRVYYGGVNVYLQQKSALFRRLPRFLDRLFDAPGLLRAAMKRAGSTPVDALGELTVSVLQGRDGRQRKELEKLIDGLREMRPDLVHLPNGFFIGLAGELKRALGVPVVCTLTGEDIFIEKLPEPHRAKTMELIRAGGKDVDAFLAATGYYGRFAIEQFGVPAERTHAVPLGISLADFEESTDAPEVSDKQEPTIGYLARVCYDKGLHILADAFAILRKRGVACRLAIAGYCGPSDRDFLDEVVRKLHAAGLAAHVDLVGETDRAGKVRFLRSLDVFSVPTVYREAKGLYVVEAMACGIPVVQPSHGAFPELIEATGGGVLCAPNDSVALADALEGLLADRAARARLGAAGHSAVREQFTAEIMAERTWAVFERCVKAARGGRT